MRSAIDLARLVVAAAFFWPIASAALVYLREILWVVGPFFGIYTVFSDGYSGREFGIEVFFGSVGRLIVVNDDLLADPSDETREA